MLDNREIEKHRKGDVVLKIPSDESVDLTVTSEIISSKKALLIPNNFQKQQQRNGWLENMVNLLRKSTGKEENEMFDTKNTDVTLGDTFNNDDSGYCHAKIHTLIGETLHSCADEEVTKEKEEDSSSSSIKIGQLESLWNSVVGSAALRKKNRKLKHQQRQKESTMSKKRSSLIRKRAGSDSSSSLSTKQEKEQFEIKTTSSANGLMLKLANHEAMIVSQSSSKSLEEGGCSPRQQLRHRPSLQVSSLVLKQDEEPLDTDQEDEDDGSQHSCLDCNSFNDCSPPHGHRVCYHLSDDIPLLFDLENEVSTWQQDLDKFME